MRLGSHWLPAASACRSAPGPHALGMQPAPKANLSLARRGLLPSAKQFVPSEIQL